MTKLLETSSVVIEQVGAGVMVTIKTVSTRRTFSKEKVGSVDNTVGASGRTVTLNMVGGEKIVLRNMTSDAARNLQRLLI